MQQSHVPVQSSSRVLEIDAVRGFALFGILMMNIMSFAGPHMEDQLTMNTSAIYSGTNSVVIFLINTLVTSNFYTMFSFLFGLGFYIFLSRAEMKQGSTYLLFIRRMLILLVIGIIHAIFIWYGDILTVYAITGLLLLFFYRLSPKFNLAISGVILLLGTIFVLLLTLLMFSIRNMDMGAVPVSSYGVDMMSAASGSYGDIISLNMSIFGLMITNNIVMVPLVLAIFLIGLYVGQKGYFDRLDSIRGLLWKVAIFGIGIGLPIKLVTGYGMTYGMDDPAWSIATMLAYTLGGPLMSLGYIAVLLLILMRFKGLTRLLQPVGQMALTNYILQSIVMIIVFFGFDLFNTIGAVWFPLIVLTTFMLQIVLSHMWMKAFSYGPLEWIWRILTYGRILPIKK